MATHQNTQTRLLQYHSIVVVRVAHGPPTNMTSCVLDVMTIDVAAVPVWPFFILIKVVELSTHTRYEMLLFSISNVISEYYLQCLTSIIM